MAGNRCPHCGSPIKIRGNRWECGWCGDFGSLSSLKGASRIKPSQESVPGLQELERGVWQILKGMEVHSPEDYKEPAFRLALYAMSHGLLNAGSSGGFGFSLVRTFLQKYPIFAYEDFQKGISSGTPVFSREFSIAGEDMGTFWQNLLPQLPSSGTDGDFPDWLTDIFTGWSLVEHLFLGSTEDLIYTAITDMFHSHWRRYRMTHFPIDDLRSSIEQWDFDENESICCRDFLIASFPEAASSFPPEKLEEMDIAELLEAMAEAQPKTALNMMKLLLDTAQDHLMEPDAAQALLGEMLYDLCINDSFLPVLLPQLEKDEALARQLFQSAYADYPQECILEACQDWGLVSLARHLKALLEKNSFFQGF